MADLNQPADDEGLLSVNPDSHNISVLLVVVVAGCAYSGPDEPHVRQEWAKAQAERGTCEEKQVHARIYPEKNRLNPDSEPTWNTLLLCVAPDKQQQAGEDEQGSGSCGGTSGS